MFTPPKWAYEPISIARKRALSEFERLRDDVSPLVAKGDGLSILRARQIAQQAQRDTPDRKAAAKNRLTSRIRDAVREAAKQTQEMAAAQGNVPDVVQGAADREAAGIPGPQTGNFTMAGQKRAGVPRGVAEAFPEEAEGRRVYDSPDPLGQKFAQTGAGGFLKEVGGMALNAGRPGVGAVNAALQGDNPIGGAFRELGDVYDAEGKPLPRYRALDNPGINRLPDRGIEAGPVNITPRTVAAFGLETATDWTNLVEVPGGGAVGRAAAKVLPGRAGREAVEQVAKPSFMQRAAPALAGAEDAAKLDPMNAASATQRLFNIRPPQQVLTRTDRALNALKSTLGAGTPEDEVATPIMRERKRVMRGVESQANRLGAIAGQVETAFERDAKGRITNLPGEPTIQDLAARLPQYQQYLTPEQVSAMQTLKREVMPYGDALRELGIDLNSRADVIEGGFYLPRGRAAEEGADVPVKVRSGRGMPGGKKGLERHATFESMTEGIDAGYEYAPFKDAVQSYGLDAGTRAIDQWTADAFKATGLGETAADRINPGLRAQVETLRAKIAQKRSTLIHQNARENALRQGARDTTRMYGNSERMAETAREQLGNVAETAARGEDIARSGARKLEQQAGRGERAARETAELAARAGERLKRFQQRIDAIKNPPPVGAPSEGVGQRAFSFQQIVASLPERQAIRDASANLREQLTRNADGQILKNRKNQALMREIGELDALGELHYALERADGDLATAMDYFNETLHREGFALESRATPGLRNTLSGTTGARARAARRRASKRGIADMYQVANRGSEQDFGILSEQVRAMNDIMEAGDFDVYDVLDTPPDLGSAPTEEVLAAAKREYNILMREARKQERASVGGWERAIAGGDALQQQAQRGTQRAFERAESGARAVDRGMRRQERIATRSNDRYVNAAGRQDATGAEYDSLRDQLASIEGDWKIAKEKAAQAPRDQGSIGLAGLNGTSFPDEVANAANKYLQDEKGISGKGSLPIKAVKALNGLLRGLRASADVSFMGIQGLLGAVTHPAEYKTALVVAMKALKDERALGAFIANFDEAATAAKLPDSRAWAAGGLRIGASDTEFEIGQGLGPKVGKAIRNAPLIKQSNRAFGFFGDAMRLEAADALARASKAGKQPLTPEHISDIAKASNLITGYSDHALGGATGELALFAPRFFASQLELVGRALTLDPSPAGDEARTALIRLIGVGSLITVGMNEARGHDTDFNPRSSNFMRIRDLGGQDISLFGPWDSLVKGIGATAEGDYTYIPRTKASPTVALAWDILSGKTFTGEDSRTPEYFMRALLPFSISDIGRESPLNTAINTTGVKASDLSPTERLDKIAQDKLGKSWRDLEPYQKADLLKANPDLASARLDRASERDQEAAATREKYIERQQSLDDQLLSGQMKREEYVDEYYRLQTERGALLDRIYGDEPITDPKTPTQKYAMFIQQSKDPATGKLDFDKLDGKMGSLTADERAYLERNIGLDDTAVTRQFRAMRKLRKERNALPKYRGYDADQANEIDEVWQEVRNLAPSAEELPMRRALRRYAAANQIDPMIYRGVHRRISGRMRQLNLRKRFDMQHPEMEVFYGRGRLTAAEVEMLSELRSAA